MFSFIIPCHNRIDALRNTLKGLGWQLGNIPFETLLIDNNSDKDNLDDLYQEYRDSLNLYLVKQPRLDSHVSMSRARNIGIGLSRYKWLVFLDSDIILPAHYLQSLSTVVKDRQPMIITAERLFIRRADIEPLSEDKLERAEQVASTSNYDHIKDRRFPYLRNLSVQEQPWAFFHGCNIVCRKEDTQRIGCFDEAYDGNWGYEDIDFAHRMITVAHCIPLYEARLHCYHQEEEEEGIERFNKSMNPNWDRICTRIEGYKAFKTQHYRSLNREGIVLSDD